MSKANVAAVDGRQYGVIGAQIHVLGDGTPLYLLGNYRRPAELRNRIPRLVKGSLDLPLSDDAIDDVLSDLDRWLNAEPQHAAMWIHGAESSGKTWLASKVGTAAQAQGWKVVSASPYQGAGFGPPPIEDLTEQADVGLLVVVDNADTWSFQALSWLLENPILYERAKKARLLLLARSIEPWPTVRALLDSADWQSSSLAFPPDFSPSEPSLITEVAGATGEIHQGLQDLFRELGHPSSSTPPGEGDGVDNDRNP